VQQLQQSEAEMSAIADVPVLAKPFNLDVLEELVGCLLSREAAGASLIMPRPDAQPATG
jgi:hypothetical protein